MGKLKNMKLKTSIIVGFVNVFILTFIIASMYYSFLKYSTNRLNNVYKQYGSSSGDLGLSYAKYNEIKVALRNALYIYEPGSEEANSYITKAQNAMSEFDDAYENFKSELNADDTELINKASETHDGVEVYFTDVEEIIAAYNSANYTTAKDVLLHEGIDSALTADGMMENLINVELRDAADVQFEDIRTRTSAVYGGTCVLFILNIIIIIVTAVVLIHKINNPLKDLMDASDKISKGDVDFNIAKRSNDELGKLVDAFNAMKENVKHHAEIAYTIANGDLSEDVRVHSERDVLGNALNILVEDNNKTLGNIKESSMQLTTGAEQVAIASQSLAQGSTEQASAIEEITASMQEIEAKTRDNANKAEKAGTLVHEAKRSASSGNEQMRNMVNAMEEINQASENISKIIKVIDDIAFQTNILALNAAVEAARAGVHGKGFAVVAEEVRNLAGKSASAASETAEMIEDSIRKVSVGSEMAQETSAALEGIMNAIDTIVELIDQITVASNEQATAVSQIDQAIGQVSQVVQTNSATSEECAAASEQLSNQASALRAAISKYKLKESAYRNYMQDSYGGEKDENERIISLGSGFGKY